MGKLSDIHELKKYEIIREYYYCSLNKKLYIQLKRSKPANEVVEFSKTLIEFAVHCGIYNIGIVCDDWEKRMDSTIIKEFETNLVYN